MRAHLVQLDSAWEDREANYKAVRRLLGGAGLRRGDLVVLPEMFDTGFSFNISKTADTDGRTLEFIRDCAKAHGIFLQGARTVIGPDSRGRNRATIAAPTGEVIAEYDKVHPFSFGREAEFFSGGEGVATYGWSSDGATTTVCPAICYDLRFPELFRIGMLRGAEVFAIGANWPAPRKHHREALGIARAIENQAYVLAVNRAGRDPHLEYQGDSFVVDPRGAVIARLGSEEGALSVDLDIEALRAWRREFPATRDIRLFNLKA